MLKQLTLWAALALLCLTAQSAYAQSSPDPKPTPAPQEKRYYRLEFTIKEVNAGKTINARTYSAVATTHSSTQLRTGTKLPYRASPGVQDYLNLGVNIDCMDLAEVGNQLALRIIADVQSVANPEDQNPGGIPIIRQNRWESGVIIPLNHPITIFSSDDLNSTAKMQLQLLATPVNEP